MDNSGQKPIYGFIQLVLNHGSVTLNSGGLNSPFTIILIHRFVKMS